LPENRCTASGNQIFKKQNEGRHRKTICEVAIDEEDRNGFRQSADCEMEIELFSGDKEDVRRFGETLAEKYGLTAETGASMPEA
jgi:hypothetical protein